MIVVTGARGFIGRYCVRELSKLKNPLFLTTSSREKISQEGKIHYLNLEELKSFTALPDTIDTVIHLAAAIPKKNEAISFSKFMDVNAMGVKLIFEAAVQRGCHRFIYASTQMVIEKPFYLPVDEVHPLVPLSDYGLSKAIGEKYCLSLAKDYNITAVSLRFARIYGAGENPGFVLTNFIGRAQRRLPLILHGSGKTLRDLLYVKDAVKAIVCVLQSKASGIFNIGSGNGISIRELAESIASVFGNGNIPVEFRHDLKDEGTDFYMSTAKATEELGFVPQYSLLEGLTDYQTELMKRKEILL